MIQSKLVCGCTVYSGDPERPSSERSHAYRGTLPVQATMSTIPVWLSKSQSASHQKYLQRTLQQRENTRASIRSLYLQRLDPPHELPRNLFDYYSIAVGCHPDNAQLKNRYVDVKPYDRTRVVLADAKGTQVLPSNPISWLWIYESLSNLEVFKRKLVPRTIWA